MDKHVNILAIINIVWSCMGLIGSAVVLIIFVGSSFIVGFEGGDEEVGLLVAIFGLIIGGTVLVTSIPALIAGIGLLRFKSWARILAIILAILDLLAFPIGTAIGVYALWVLFNEDTIALFEKSPTAVPT
jgi:hypothetical protein